MRLERCQEKCVAKLRCGECRRVPRSPSRYLAGYYVGCPACGFPQVIRCEDATITERGMDVGETPRLSISQIKCWRCACVFRIDLDEIIIIRAASHAG